MTIPGPVATPSRTNYVLLLSGVSIASALVLVWFAFRFQDTRATIAAFKGPVSVSTAIASHPLFLWLAPAGVASAVLLNHRFSRDRRLRCRIAILIAAVAAAAVVFCYFANTLPFTDLADNVRAS